ncbi:hypothetical protein PR048_022960 [Dryococelus australis]|uniref:Uncharacterized protein n=1 Tax=Dryococelus australis TaxID=614101 RepID=A0ABQ9GST7_9NEOP|nr:hypothetical protein PR048_022960 [Dryococelus australis]
MADGRLRRRQTKLGREAARATLPRALSVSGTVYSCMLNIKIKGVQHEIFSIHLKHNMDGVAPEPAISQHSTRGVNRQALATRALSCVVKVPACLQLSSTFETEKLGRDKGDIATCIKCPIAATREALNWRAVFSSLCGYLWDFQRRPCYFIDGKSVASVSAGVTSECVLQILSNRPLSVDASREMPTDWEQSEFVNDCLYWHNVYRLRHRAPALALCSQQSSDTHKTPYDRVKRCRERKIDIKASETIEMSMEQRRNEGARKQKIPEETRRPATSSGTIPTCENPGVTRPRIEPGPFVTVQVMIGFCSAILRYRKISRCKRPVGNQYLVRCLSGYFTGIIKSGAGSSMRSEGWEQQHIWAYPFCDWSFWSCNKNATRNILDLVSLESDDGMSCPSWSEVSNGMSSKSGKEMYCDEGRGFLQQTGREMHVGECPFWMHFSPPPPTTPRSCIRWSAPGTLHKEALHNRFPLPTPYLPRTPDKHRTKYRYLQHSSLAANNPITRARTTLHISGTLKWEEEGLCSKAQAWANHLAHANTFYYRNDRDIGQNLFCRPVSDVQNDVTGQEVSSYWYSAMRQYNFSKEPDILHANVNAGRFLLLLPLLAVIVSRLLLAVVVCRPLLAVVVSTLLFSVVYMFLYKVILAQFEVVVAVYRTRSTTDALCRLIHAVGVCRPLHTNGVDEHAVPGRGQGAEPHRQGERAAARARLRRRDDERVRQRVEHVQEHRLLHVAAAAPWRRLRVARRHAAPVPLHGRPALQPLVTTPRRADDTPSWLRSTQRPSLSWAPPACRSVAFARCLGSSCTRTTANPVLLLTHCIRLAILMAGNRCAVLQSCSSCSEETMKQRRNEREGKMGDTRENLPTNSIVQHDSHMQKPRHDKPDLSWILFGNEELFTNHDQVNFRNMHYWSVNNPHWLREMEQGTVDSQKYVNLFPQMLEDLPLQTRRILWYQHDGYPAHSERRTTASLHQLFQNHWIIRRRPVRWPSRSPDLKPLDFFSGER